MRVVQMIEVAAARPHEVKAVKGGHAGWVSRGLAKVAVTR